MSNGSTATKWVVGCLLAGTAFMIAVCVGGVLMVRRGIQEASEAMEEVAAEMERQGEVMQQASNWNLPGGWAAPADDATADMLLPLEAGGWERSFVNTESTIPVINIERPADSGVYATGSSSLDVYVSRVEAEEKDTVFELSEIGLQGNNGGRMTQGSDDGTTRTLFFQSWGLNGEENAGWLVWNGGWLFLVHASEEPELLGEFMTSFFAAIDASSAAIEEVGTTTESDSPPESVGESDGGSESESDSEPDTTSEPDAATEADPVTEGADSSTTDGETP